MDHREAKQAKARQQLIKEAATIAAPFLSEDGQKSLKLMKEMFYDVLIYEKGITTEQMYVREGFRGLIHFIQESITIAVKGAKSDSGGEFERKPDRGKVIGTETPKSS